jgi:hypothetical protein
MRTGRQVAKIVRHEFSATVKGTPYLNVTLDVAGEFIGGPVWFTDKAMGMARATLKLMGFDPDSQETILLDTNPTLLAGRTVLVDIQENEYNGKVTLQAKYVLDSVDKKAISDIQKKLRAAKHVEQSAPLFQPTVQPEDEIPF